MEKFLVTIEFRYTVQKQYSKRYISKTVTIGVYETFDEACLNANKVLENLESRFKLHKFPNGLKANKERFSKNGGCFGSEKTLITNSAYLKTPFEFYFQITSLKYQPVNNVIDEILKEI
jgi:hypothetical protein